MRNSVANWQFASFPKKQYLYHNIGLKKSKILENIIYMLHI